MRFTDPWYALLILPVIAGLILSWRHVHGMAKIRKRIAFTIRAALATSLVLALMGPQLARPNVGLATIFVVDRSDSVSPEEVEAARAFISQATEALGPDDLAGVVTFGSAPAVESAPGGKRSMNRFQASVEPAASDLAAALRLAAATFPDGKARRIVLLSDGNETKGDAAGAAQAAAREGIEIDHVPLGVIDRRAEAAVLELDAPSDRRADEPFEVRVVMESSVAQSGTLVLDRDGVVVQRVPVQLPAGRSSVVLTEKLSGPGFFRYRATLQPEQDSDTRNNIGAGFVTVRGKPRVLLLQSDPSRTELARALKNQGIEVDLYGPEGVPIRPEQIQPYDAVFLNDLNARYLAPQQMSLFQAAVRDTGVGLAMIGGEDSFLPGGWYGTPVAEALPVDLDVRQRKSFPSTTVLIVIDTSGSMGMVEDGYTKLQLAAEAASQTAQLLSPLDRVGVAGSTDGIELVAPIQELSDKSRVISQIKKLSLGGGGIYGEASIRFAAEKLRAENTKVRHFLLLADGNDVDTHGTSLLIIAQMLSEKITTSVVAIGDGKDVPFLRQVAAVGGGRFYLADKASKLPAIFTQDVAVMSRSAIEEGVFVPKAALGEPILRGISASEIPALFAYCLTDAKPLARVGMRSQKDDPILASWQYGLGTSIAFTSDAQSKWARRWVPWDGFSRFWAQAARATSRRATLNDYSLKVSPSGGRGEVTLEARDRLGNPITSPDTAVRVSGPDGSSREVTLSQEAPGVFKGSFAAADLGSYIVSVAEPSPDGLSRVSSSGFSIPYPPEYRAFRANEPLLTRISEETNGKRLAEPEEALRPASNPGESVSEIWAWFVLFAALLLPVDVATRRVAIPVAEGVRKLVALLARRRAKAEPSVPAHIGRLQTARKRTESDQEPEPVGRRVVIERREKQDREPTPVSQGSAASKLLESKRKRQDSGDGE